MTPAQLSFPGLARSKSEFAPELASTAGVVFVSIRGLRLVNETNVREHWAVRAKRAREQRMVVKASLGALPSWCQPPLRITIARLGKRRMDTGNLGASCKHVQDGVADWLGVDDGSTELDWHYRQHVDPSAPYGVMVRIEKWDGREIGVDNMPPAGAYPARSVVLADDGPRKPPGRPRTNRRKLDGQTGEARRRTRSQAGCGGANGRQA